MRHTANDDFHPAAPLAEREFWVAEAGGPDWLRMVSPTVEQAAIGYLKTAGFAAFDEITLMVLDADTGAEQSFRLALGGD